MCAKDNRNKDQKRKAKLAQRARRAAVEEVTPYEGEKYRAPEWTDAVFETELAVYETIVLSGHRLTNDQVQRTFVNLVRQLRKGRAPAPTAGETGLTYTEGGEEEWLAWNLRRHWAVLAERGHPVGRDDLIGILRTLLYSIKAHAWNTGPMSGYVHFIEGFMKRAGVDVRAIPSSQLPRGGRETPPELEAPHDES
jgi:hypothetical protein